MRDFIKLIVFLSIVSSASSSRYNILSLDAGTYKGIITAKFIDFMEFQAFNIAKRDVQCFDQLDADADNYYSKNTKIPMNKLFDMIAGSESGAIIAASLAIPDENDPTKAKYFAKESLKWFEDNSDMLYHDKKMPVWLQIFILILILALFLAATEAIAQKCFAVTKYQKAYQQVKMLFVQRKKQIKGALKGKKMDQAEAMKLRIGAEMLSKFITDNYSSDKTFSHITLLSNKLNTLHEACKNEDHGDAQATISKHDEHLEELQEIRQMLSIVEVKQQKRLTFRIVALILTATIMWLFSWYIIIPGVKYLFMSTKDASVLEAKINELIPADASIENIATQDLMLTAWDLNHRAPRLFTQWSFRNLKSQKQESRMSLSKMTLASAATPYYFRPATIPDVNNVNDGKDYLYISGDNVAQSPAMYSMLHAIDKGLADEKDICVVSVGNINQESEKIEKQASLLEWALRLATLTGPVKKHTQDYMSKYFLEQGGHDFHKFELQKSEAFNTDLYMTSGSRLNALQGLGQDMIYSNRFALTSVLKQIISERFVCPSAE